MLNQVLIATRQPVAGDGEYIYDSLYRLIQASGREHPGQQPTNADTYLGTIPHPNNTNALIRYTENYSYDQTGNILSMQHIAGAGSWTRGYQYGATGNRLMATSAQGDPPGKNSDILSQGKKILENVRKLSSTQINDEMKQKEKWGISPLKWAFKSVSFEKYSDIYGYIEKSAKEHNLSPEYFYAVLTVEGLGPFLENKLKNGEEYNQNEYIHGYYILGLDEIGENYPNFN